MMNPSDSKKAFISYAHSDKEFVRELVESLNRNAVPLFYDEWDIQPGDSIINKIFEKGLAESAFFFVVLSEASVNSRWVRDELDVATVRRIEGMTRVVPILKENCEIPWSLRSLRWLDMRQDFEAGVRELTKLVHGADDRPPPGEIPSYIRGLAESIGGLSREGTTIGLYLLDRADIDGGTILQVGGEEIQQATKLTPQEINDAVDELEGSGLVRTIKWMGTSPYGFGVGSRSRSESALGVHLSVSVQRTTPTIDQVHRSDTYNYASAKRDTTSSWTGWTPDRGSRERSDTGEQHDRLFQPRAGFPDELRLVIQGSIPCDSL